MSRPQQFSSKMKKMSNWKAKIGVAVNGWEVIGIPVVPREDPNPARILIKILHTIWSQHRIDFPMDLRHIEARFDVGRINTIRVTNLSYNYTDFTNTIFN